MRLRSRFTFLHVDIQLFQHPLLKIFIFPWRTIWRFCKKLKTELSYDHAVPLLSTYPEKTQFEKIYAPPTFTAALFKISKTWKQLRCSLTDEWINMQYIYMHNGMFLGH